MDINWSFIPVQQQADTIDLNVGGLLPDQLQSATDLFDSEPEQTENVPTFTLLPQLEPLITAGFNPAVLEQIQDELARDKTLRINPDAVQEYVAKPEWLAKALLIQPYNSKSIRTLLNPFTRVALPSSVPTTRISPTAAANLDQQVQDLLDRCV